MKFIIEINISEILGMFVPNCDIIFNSKFSSKIVFIKISLLNLKITKNHTIGNTAEQLLNWAGQTQTQHRRNFVRCASVFGT